MNAPTILDLADASAPAIDWCGDESLRDDELRAYLSRVWRDDALGFLVDEARAILRGKIKAVLTDRHVEAICEANRRAVEVRQWAANNAGDETPF